MNRNPAILWGFVVSNLLKSSTSSAKAYPEPRQTSKCFVETVNGRFLFPRTAPSYVG